MTCCDKNEFFRLYRVFFIINGALCLLFLVICAFVPSRFGFLNHTLRTCARDQELAISLLRFWMWDILPMCVVFLAGLTIYIPVLSALCSAFTGVIFALDMRALLSGYGVFFAVTVLFIRLCAAWLQMWYLSYISTASVRLYTKSAPFFKSFDYIFLGKYIIWFAVFALSDLALDLAQCLMYRI